MPLIELVPASPADADLLATMHADSWRHAYAGLIPAEYLEHHAANERRILARPDAGRRAPLDVTILRRPAGGIFMPDAACRARLRHLSTICMCSTRTTAGAMASS
jgi:hypothetical protein